jgi:sodium-dependent dicarboxylate transporter 2/3/5
VVGVHGAAVVEFTGKYTLSHYAHPVIYLFFGGFLLAAAMQKWGLDRRLTLWLLTRGNLANSPAGTLLAVMGVTAFLSMWVSNTATAAMMLPLGLGILSAMGSGSPGYRTALMLGIAWAASIGGVGTVIGTPPNAIALGILQTTFAGDPAFHRITFLHWLSFGIPFVVVMIPAAWFLLVLVSKTGFSPGGNVREMLARERDGQGPLSTGERRTISIFLLAVVFWISNPFWDTILPSGLARQLVWIDEFSIGLMAGVLLFLVPVDLKKRVFLLEWKDTAFVDWGTLLLFGGGIALSDAMFRCGLATWLGTVFTGMIGSPSPIVMVFFVVAFVGMLTEVTSNTAVTTMMVPVLISMAMRTGGDPSTLAVAAACGASLAFMLPVATPPNALVYATGHVTVRDMVKHGFMIEILGWFITVGILLVFADRVFGVIRF